MMNDKLKATIRNLLVAGGAYAVGKGWIPESVVDELSGAIVTLIGVGWSLFRAHKSDEAAK